MEINLTKVEKIKVLNLIDLYGVMSPEALIEPMEVFSFVLQKRAVQIILCHNHPSG